MRRIGKRIEQNRGGREVAVENRKKNRIGQEREVAVENRKKEQNKREVVLENKKKNRIGEKQSYKIEGKQKRISCSLQKIGKRKERRESCRKYEITDTIPSGRSKRTRKKTKEVNQKGELLLDEDGLV